MSSNRMPQKFPLPVLAMSQTSLPGSFNFNGTNESPSCWAPYLTAPPSTASPMSPTPNPSNIEHPLRASSLPSTISVTRTTPDVVPHPQLPVLSAFLSSEIANLPLPAPPAHSNSSITIVTTPVEASIRRPRKQKSSSTQRLNPRVRANTSNKPRVCPVRLIQLILHTLTSRTLSSRSVARIAGRR